MAKIDLAQWLYATKIIIHGTKVLENVTDYVVYVPIHTTHDIFQKAKTDGADIRFALDDGTLLKFERSRYDATNNKADFFVHIPVLRAGQDCVLWLYYGNPNARDANNPFGTWANTNAQLAVHTNTTNMVNSVDGSPVTNMGDGDPVVMESDQIPVAMVTNDPNNYYANEQPVPGGTVTQEIIFQEDEAPLTTYAFLLAYSGNIEVLRAYRHDSGYSMAHLFWPGENGSPSGHTYGNNLHKPTHWVFVWHPDADNSNYETVKVYKDGELLGTAQASDTYANHKPSVPGVWRLGAYAGPQQATGYLAEPRIWNGGKSDNWVKTQYYNTTGKLVSISTQVVVLAKDTFAIDLYPMLYQSLRLMDTNGVLHAIMDTFSEALDTTLDQINTAMPKLVQPTQVPGQYLPLLAELLGIPKDRVQDIAYSNPDKLRLWVTYLPIFWKGRGTKGGLQQLVEALTVSPAMVWGYWDRVITLDPDNGWDTTTPGLVGESENTHNLVQVYAPIDEPLQFEKNLLGLMRPTSRTLDLYHLDYVDDFRFGAPNWQHSGSVKIAIERYDISPNPPAIVPQRFCLWPGVDPNPNQVVLTTVPTYTKVFQRMRVVLPQGADMRVYFDYQDANNYAYLQLSATDKPVWHWAVGGTTYESQVDALPNLRPGMETEVVLVWEAQTGGWYLEFDGLDSSGILNYTTNTGIIRLDVVGNGSDPAEVRMFGVGAWPLQKLSLAPEA